MNFADINEIRNIDLEARVEIASKVGRIMAHQSGKLDKSGALELARVLVDDVSVSVREALSRELKTCSFLPEDLIDTLVNDIDQISLPFLITSQAVDDVFLEEIVRSCGSEAQEAIAQRNGISEALAYVISDVGSLPSVNKLAENARAEMSLRSFNRLIDRFPEDCSLMEKLVQRGDFPPDVVEKIIFKVSRQYGEYLTSKFDMAVDYASYLVSIAKRQVFSRTLEAASLPEIENYLRQLNGNRMLTSDILLGYLQNRNLRLFIMSLSILLAIPYERVKDAIDKRDKTVLARLLDAAGFSKSVIGVMLIAYDRLLQAL